jgi:hypothetical protein
VRQHGVVALFQLVAMGMDERTVRARVAAGRLHRVHRGVFAVGHRVLGEKGHWMAAVLACGEGAVLSHVSAASLLGLLRGSGPISDVSSPTRAGRRRARIRVHRGSTLLPRDTVLEEGIPCTSVARTLLDLAEILKPRQLESAIGRAETLEIFDLTAINDVLARANGRRGAPLLREAIRIYENTGTRNAFERLFLALCDRAGVPRPLVNAPLGEIVPDFMWPEYKVIVETDGWETHGPRSARRRDLARDRDLTLAGWRVARFTWVDVRYEPDEVVRTLRGLLVPAT